MLMAAFRILLTIFALFLIAGGIVLSISPIPFGFVFILLGFFLLVCVAPAFVRFFRRRWRWLDRRMHWLERKLPGFLAKPLRASDYEHEDEDDEEKKRRAKARRARRPRPEIDAGDECG